MAMHTEYLTMPKDKNFMKNSPSIMDFKEWKVIENRFPYDTIAKVHHLLVPKRQFTHFTAMNEYELAELEGILENELAQAYDMISYNFPKNQSVKSWLHYHLILLK